MALQTTSVFDQLFSRGQAGSLPDLYEFTPEDLNLPLAWAGHLPFAYWLIQAMKPKTFVELGTHTANSYLAFCQSISKHKTGTKAFAIDTWSGDEHSGVYGSNVFAEVEVRNLKYSNFSTLIKSTFDEALTSFSDNSIDLLHIDGLHTFEAVKHDFYSWLPKMSPSGVVLFHDITVFDRGFGVHKLWDLVSKDYPSFEFVHSHGLGVIQLPGNSSNIIETLQRNADATISLFSHLGDAIIRSGELQQRLGGLENKNKELLREIERLNYALAHILNSKSWKYTSLFRDLFAIPKGRRSEG